MAALIAVVCLGMALAHWLMSPLSGVMTPLVELHPLPWLLVLAMLWLLAGQRGTQL